MHAKYALAALAPAAAVQGLTSATAVSYVTAFSGTGCTGTVLSNFTDGVTCGTFGICVPESANKNKPSGSLFFSPEASTEGTPEVVLYSKDYCSTATGVTLTTKGCYTPKTGTIASFLANCAFN